MKLITLLLTGVAVLGLSTEASAQQALPQVNDAYFKAAQQQLATRLALQPITGKAKNIILMVGDGMSMATVTAARIYEGQKRGVDGESNNSPLTCSPMWRSPRPIAMMARFPIQRQPQRP